MNLTANILNQIPANQTRQHIKMIRHHDQLGFIQQMKRWLSWLARFWLKWRPPHSEVDLGKGGDVLILTMLHSQRGRPWWQASKVCIETEDKEYCLLCSSWGQELHLTIFIAPRVTKSTDSGEDAVVTSKWKHSPTVLKKPLASV